MSARLCDKCTALINWPIADSEKWSGAVYPHYSRTRLLQASAENNCHLCILLLQCLHHSRRPEGEIDLPDRQVWLEYAPPEASTGKHLRISASIQAESLATAGRHDFSEVPNDSSYVQLPKGSYENGLHLAESNREVFDEETLWVLWDDIGPVYFLGAEIITDDLFWAIVLPYHSGILELYHLPGKLLSILQTWPRTDG